MNRELKAGDYVRYASNGICKITDVKELDLTHRGVSAEYYILQPVSDAKSVLYVPKNNDKLTSKMSEILGKDEIDRLILSAKSESVDWIDDRNARARYFQEVLVRSDRRELIMLINCIYLKKQLLAEAGKKLCATDEKVLKRAESSIENDFSFVLGIDKDSVGKYICEKLGINAAS